MNAQFDFPWVCAGDFNEILKSHEKMGGRPLPVAQMQEFRDAIDECGFQDLGFMGNKFTWHKTVMGGGIVWERLDRAVANSDWEALFPSSKVSHLECGCSDHKPIIIHPLGIPIRQNKPWRFEQVWLQDEGCHATVEEVWVSTKGYMSLLVSVKTKLERVQKGLKNWSKNSFGNITKQLGIVRKNLREAEAKAMQNGRGQMDLVLSLKEELRSLLVQEEKLWQQRAKTAWLKDGDQNSKFFYSRASHYFRRNEILKLQRDDGSWCEGEHQIAPLFVNYFSTLFRFDDPDIGHIDDVLAVTPEMNLDLLAEFTKSEVDVALKQMAPLKAPGPDGLPPIFYQHYWNKIGGDVAKAVLTWFNSGIICPSFNHTYITLDS